MATREGTMDTLFHLIYVSSSNGLMNEEQLSDLLESIRPLNEKHSITGMLLYQEGNIMQIIEGEKKSITQLFRNIQSDHRHTRIIKLIEEPISSRNFSDWTMSYLNVSPVKIDGFSDFMLSGSFNEKKISTAKKLLLGFRAQLRATHGESSK
jgi:hypothetical protein